MEFVYSAIYDHNGIGLFNVLQTLFLKAGSFLKASPNVVSINIKRKVYSIVPIAKVKYKPSLTASLYYQ